MELRELETFRAVATLLSVSRAAESLNYAQSTVTAQIQSIEREFEVPLFDRLGKRLRLAEGGRRLLDYADRMLRLADEARAAVNGHEPTTGTISIGATESLCAYRLPNVIQVFRGRFPAARVRLHSGIGSALRRRLGDGSIDMAFLMQGTAQDNDLVVEELMVEKLVVIAAPGHRHANRRKLNFSELDGETVLATERGRSYRETFEHALERAGARPAVTLEFGSIEAIKHCVMADVGIAILPEVAVREELARGSLASLDIQGPAFTIVTQMA
ncbi:MAG TPA: LysR family transcriptional regulator, partial [Candidatus Dormibacteraeota bacterium]|nr:LysR family transcriptional regulator [Candidatus Dormibacteraeota bacterium]